MDDLESARATLRTIVQKARQFSGWRFDEFAPKELGPALPWSYEYRAAELLTNAGRVLDLGTGGGEVFGDLCRSFRGRAVASEEWHVNAPIAATRLRPLGVDVVRCRSLVLPFRDGTFDLVLSRHEELDPAEVGRVLAPHGHVLTQQVGRLNWIELNEFFPRRRDFGDLFYGYREDLRAAGLTVDQALSHVTEVAYRGLGDIVFMLCVAPWEIPDFDPLHRDLQALLDFERTSSTEEGIVLTESRFLIEAHKRPRTSRRQR